MKLHGSVRVARMWCGRCTNSVLNCFSNLEALNCGELLVGVVLELTNWLTSETEHRSAELGSEWSLGHHSGVRAS
jgi:hypothetical protein